MIERQVATIRKVFPKSKIIMVAGWRAELVNSRVPADVRLLRNPIYDRAGVVESMRIGLAATKSTEVILIYGDILFNEATIKGLGQGGSVVVVTGPGGIVDNESVGVTIA